MSISTGCCKTAAKQWADNFLTRVSKENGAIEFDAETSLISAHLTWKEAQIQREYDEGNDPGKDEEPGLLRILTDRLDFLKLPRTRATEIIAVLGVNTPGQAVMMAAVLKRLHEIQTPKQEKLTALRLDCLLSCGTITQEFFQEMWDLQKGYTCGIHCDNLLDVITSTDLEN